MYYLIQINSLARDQPQSYTQNDYNRGGSPKDEFVETPSTGCCKE